MGFSWSQPSAQEADESPSEVLCPFDAFRPFEGIIAHLTKKHGGNVHEKGIVKIASKSVNSDLPAGLESRNFPVGFMFFAVKNVADLARASYFLSKPSLRAENEWVSWDFQDRRVRLTHYTLRMSDFKLWDLEGSVDGEFWKLVHRGSMSRPKGDERVCFDLAVISFPVSDLTDFRFIRLTLIESCDHYNNMCLGAVEFFGILTQ
jgi:hypothetical protein